MKATTTGLLAIVMLLAACATDPTARWAQQRSALTTVQNTISDLHESGIIDDEQLLAVEPGVKAARAALAHAFAELPDGGTAFESYMSLAKATLGTLRQFYQPKPEGE